MALVMLTMMASALAAPPAECAAEMLAAARSQLDDVVEDYRAARAGYFDTDWKNRMAVSSAVEREQVVIDRELARDEIRLTRATIKEARRSWRRLRNQASDGAVSCDVGTVAAEQEGA